MVMWQGWMCFVSDLEVWWSFDGYRELQNVIKHLWIDVNSQCVRLITDLIDLKTRCVMCIGSRKSMIAIDNLPSGNVLGILAVAWAIRVSDLEDCSDRASVLASDAFEANVVFSAVLWVSMSRERTGVGDFSGSWACESVGDFYNCENVI